MPLYYSKKQDSAGVSCAVLIATGVSVSLEEGRAHWRRFLNSLKKSNIPGIRMITGDDHIALRAALRATFNGVQSMPHVHIQRKASNPASGTEENIPEGFTVFMPSPHQRKRLRSTKMIERLTEEIKHRTRIAALFPNRSLLRLASAILMEITEEWEPGKKYFTLENDKIHRRIY